MAYEGTSLADTILLPAPLAGDPLGYIIYAHGGNDVVVTTFSGAVVAGDEGDDAILLYGTGSDLAAGGSGNDFVIDAGDGPDQIFGDDGDDWLDGGFGDDILDAGSGNDQVFGGFGRDYATGGAGNDWLWGQYGDDQLSGDAGDDVLFGGDGDDEVLGGDGNDVLSGDEGADYIGGGSGTDFIYGGPGNDWVEGGDGGDLVFAGEGNDTIRGGVGQDQLWGGQGIDGFAVMTQPWLGSTPLAQGHPELGLLHVASGASPTWNSAVWDAFRHDVIADWSQADNDVIDLPGMLPLLHWGTDQYGVQAITDGFGGTYVLFKSGTDGLGTASAADDIDYYCVLVQLIGVSPDTIDSSDLVL